MANNMSDMIATMALNGATKEELHRCIEYSSAVIQLEKMRDEKGINELERKYCNGEVCDVTQSPIEYEPKTFEEETDIMDCFFDKYESLIQTAPRNSLLGMIRDLDEAVMGIAGHRIDVDHLSKESENDENLKTAEACITHVAVLLAQMWADENQDIELSCVDPATGEEAVITGKENE